MARPREFDPEIAIAGATEIFWRQGYKATNLPDLLAAMGLTRGSFYKAFRDKESVYLRALDHYDHSVVTPTVKRLDECDSDSAGSCLALLFSNPIEDRRGCFICNAMVELAPESVAVAEKANAMAKRLGDAIQEVLERCPSEHSGRISQDTAELVLHLYFGHQAMGKAGDQGVDWARQLRQLLGDDDAR